MAMCDVRCSWCGPASLPEWSGRNIECECAASERGIDVSNFEEYCQCSGCERIFSIECLESICLKSKKAQKEWPPTFELDDKKGVWAAIFDVVWRDDSPEHPAVFTKKSATQAGTFKVCICCEDYVLSEGEARLPETFRLARSDTELLRTLVVPVVPRLPDGRDGDEVLLAPELLEAWPLVAEMEAEDAFKGGRGTLEVYGKVDLYHAPPTPVLARVNATVAADVRLSHRLARLVVCHRSPRQHSKLQQPHHPSPQLRCATSPPPLSSPLPSSSSSMPPPPPTVQRLQACAAFASGQRVLAKWPGQPYGRHAGTVLQVDATHVHVNFDDGTCCPVLPNACRLDDSPPPVGLHEGRRVQSVFPSGPRVQGSAHVSADVSAAAGGGGAAAAAADAAETTFAAAYSVFGGLGDDGLRAAARAEQPEPSWLKLHNRLNRSSGMELARIVRDSQPEPRGHTHALPRHGQRSSTRKQTPSLAFSSLRADRKGGAAGQLFGRASPSTASASPARGSCAARRARRSGCCARVTSGAAAPSSRPRSSRAVSSARSARAPLPSP